MQTFNEIQKLIGKTKGKVVGDLMTPAPLVVRESTNLEDAARYYFFLFLMLLSRVLCEFVSVYVQFSVTSYVNL